MANEINPSEIAKKFKWDIYELREFCAQILEDANDHSIAMALRAINYGEDKIAKDLISLHREHIEAGELTPELREKMNRLMDKLSDYSDR